jgi:cytochrome P450
LPTHQKFHYKHASSKLNHLNRQDTISSELQDIFQGSDRPPTVEDLHEMKYLECCIREGLRLYPSVPYIARLLKEDTVLSNVFVCLFHS